MGMHWLEIMHQVGIAVKEMFGVGGVHTSFFISYQQFIFCQQIKECISAYQYFSLLKEGLQHK